MKYSHEPVLLNEIIEQLELVKGGRYIDCTLGGAGYAIAIAKKIGEHGMVVGFDMDSMAIQNAQKRITKEKLNNILLINENFSNLQKNIRQNFNKEDKFNGIVFDLGLSNAQFEDGARGFSFKMVNAPLDMAFGEKSQYSTYKIVNYWKKEELMRIIREYGEERFAKKIAENIALARKEKTIETIKELVEIIARSIPAKYRNLKIHFATKTFQALRIATNNELDNISKALPQAVNMLNEGGKLAVVSFHSLEDRIVKQFIKNESRACICPPKLPICACNHKKTLDIFTKKPIVPKKDELERNPKSRSAKLRVAIKV